MIIHCPECGANVSDQANACIHCGFPLTQHRDATPAPSQNTHNVPRNYVVRLNKCGTWPTIQTANIVAQYNRSEPTTILSYLKRTPVVLLQNTDLSVCQRICAELAANGLSADVVNASSASQLSKLPLYDAGLPDNPDAIRCPRCGSTAISTGQRGWKLTTGFIGSSQTENRCAKCGYTWKPSRWD